MTLKMLKDQKKVFFGIRADSDVIDKYRTLLMNPEDSGSRDEQSFNIATTRFGCVQSQARRTLALCLGRTRATSHLW